MKIAQTITDFIISEIEQTFSGINGTGNSVTGEGIGIKDVDGRVVTMDAVQGERKYIGLDDTKGTYFYIRITGQAAETALNGNTRRGSCGVEIQARYPMRLVIQHRCQTASDLVESIKHALFTTNFTKQIWGYDVTNIRLIPVAVNVIPWTIYQEETGQQPKTLHSELQFAAVDFVLQFVYTYSDKCIDFKIC
jgi:hypothetical protein